MDYDRTSTLSLSLWIEDDTEIRVRYNAGPGEAYCLVSFEGPVGVRAAQLWLSNEQAHELFLGLTTHTLE